MNYPLHAIYPIQVAAFCLLSFSAWAQNLAVLPDHPTPGTLTQDVRMDQQQQVQPLKNALQALEKRYQVHFNYDAKTIGGIAVPSTTKKNQPASLEKTLTRYLEQHHLGYKKLEEGYYMIYQLPDPTVAPVKRQLVRSDPPSFRSLSPPEKVKNRQIIQQPLLEKIITGQVTDLSTGESLPGVNVVVKATTVGTVTDVEGNYRLTAPDDAETLIFSSVGYVSEEVAIGNRTTINLEMNPDVQSLSEVVVIGYGSVKKADLTGSVSKIETETLEAAPVYNMEQALKVGAAGVRVSQNSGTPGSRIEVRIRGGNSLIGDNQPLYVVDGFPVTGGIEFLNPSDIESVDILKDASATAIYGSRGANGVVIITSKRGARAGDDKVEINSLYGIQEASNRYDLLNAKEYAVVANEWLKNEDLPPFFNVDEVQNPGTDWWDAIFRQAPVQNHTLTFSGGSEKGRYSVSGNYFDQQGIITNTGASRGSIRMNLDRQMKSWLKLGVNLQLARNERTAIPIDNGARGSTALSGAASAPPTLPLYDEDGLPTRIEQAYSFGSADMRNPLIFLQRKDRSLSNSVLANTTLDVTFSPALSFKTLIGLQYRNTLDEDFSPIIFQGDRGSAAESNLYNSSFLTENVLTYSKTLNERHSLNIIGGVTYQTNLNRRSRVSVNGFANNITENFDLGAAEVVNNPSSSFSDWTLISFLSRVNYTLLNKYLFTASIRADGSSRFGADNKWGYFPSGAIGWRVSDEAFLANSSFISELKLRASYGITGNTALNPYQSLDRLRSTFYIYEGQSEVTGFVPDGIANSDLKWETTQQFDIGVDFNVLDNRLRFVLDYYRKNTNDLLASVPLPPTVGFGTILQNVGEIRNEGFEFSVDADVLTGDLAWDISAQFSRNVNEVISLAGESDIFDSGQGALWPSANIGRVGEPLAAFYGLLEDGLNEEGFIQYQDLSGPNGEPDGVINALDRVVLGSYHPDFIYGFSSNLRYRTFELNVQLEGVQGNEIFNGTLGTHLNSFQRGQNQFTDIIGNYWTEENPDPNAKYPKISRATQVTVSDRFIEDASYLRVRAVKLAFNLPIAQWGLKGFEMAQIYVSGTNLLTLTNYSGLDPEVNTWGTDSNNIGTRLRFGHDQSSYPNARIYSVGLKLRF